MPSAERNLISKILQTRDLSEVVDAGIAPKFFLEADHRDAYLMILDHQSQYSVVPTEETFRLDYPTYRLTSAEEPISFYLDEVKRGYTVFLFENGMAEAFDFHEEEQDTQAAIHRLSQMLSDINNDVSGSRVVDITQTGDARMERYIAYTKRDGSLRGIPTGFERLDRATMGWEAGQLIVFVGPKKAGKSTMMLLSAMAAHCAGYVPLFMGFEMSNMEQEERHDSIRAGVSHKKLREGTLNREDMEKIRSSMVRNRSMPPLIFTEDAGSLTVSGVAAHIDRYKPHVAFIDGVYMMDDENGEPKGSPRAITNITRSLKQLGKNLKIPMVISTQVLDHKMSKSKGVTSESVGYSSSFGQDCDHMIAVENTDDDYIKKLKKLLGRSSPYDEWFMQWDWDTVKFEELVDPREERDASPVTF